MAREIDILVVEPGKAPRPVKAEANLEAFQKIVGGPIEAGCYLPQRVMLICRENAKHGTSVAGKFLLCGLGEDRFDSLTAAQRKEFEACFALSGPEGGNQEE